MHRFASSSQEPYVLGIQMCAVQTIYVQARKHNLIFWGGDRNVHFLLYSRSVNSNTVTHILIYYILTYTPCSCGGILQLFWLSQFGWEAEKLGLVVKRLAIYGHLFNISNN